MTIHDPGPVPPDSTWPYEEKPNETTWSVPKVTHDQRASVGPRIQRDGWIRREAGTSDSEHTRFYAAQLLAAADEADRLIREAT